MRQYYWEGLDTLGSSIVSGSLATPDPKRVTGLLRKPKVLLINQAKWEVQSLLPRVYSSVGHLPSSFATLSFLYIINLLFHSQPFIMRIYLFIAALPLLVIGNDLEPEPLRGSSFVSRRSQVIDLNTTPLDRAHNLKLRTGFSDYFSLAGLKHRLHRYSQDFYSFVKLHTLFASSERSSRVLAALGLSVVLIFLIFFVALQLQRAVIMRAFEEAEKDAPRITTQFNAVAAN